MKGAEVIMIGQDQAYASGELQGDIRRHPGFSNGKEQPKIYWSTSAGQVFVVAGKSLYLMKPGAKNRAQHSTADA